MQRPFLFVLAALVALPALADGSDVSFSAKPAVSRTDGKVTVRFQVSAATDVEVAIVNAGGKVVRHLAAGVLGGENPPPPPLRPGLGQQIEWDGTDDYGQKPAGGPFSVRVRIGMGVKLDRIVGGDPYTWYSDQVGQDNHAGWALNGLEAKSDGSVYVVGNLNFYGPAAVRGYDAEGNYKRTVYPPPAGKPVDQMTGWGINIRQDGSYVLRHDNLDSSSPGTAGIATSRAGLANLIPSADPDTLLFLNREKAKINLLSVNADGTNPRTLGLLVKEPPIVDPAGKPTWTVTGHPFVAPAGDGKHFYLSGLFADDGGVTWRRADKVLTSGFWRDGQVWKVNRETGQAEVFFALDADTIPADMGKRGKALGDSSTSAFASFQGVAVDGDGNVFICDRLNKRVVVVDSAGKILRELPVENPDAVAVDPGSRALYVTRRWGNYHRNGELHLLKFADWSKDDKPSASMEIKPVKRAGTYGGASHLAAVRSGGKTFVWLAYVALPVHIYQDTDAGLKLVKDFFEAGSQRAMDLQHVTADPRNDDVYVHGGFGNLFRVGDWSDPKLVRVAIDGPEPISKHEANMALGFAIDPRSDYFYMRRDRRPVYRYRREGDKFVLAPFGDAGESAVTPKTANDWRINLGFGERGMAVAPDGGLGILVSFNKNGYTGPLSFFPADPDKAPWEGMFFKVFGASPKSAGIRFDPQGNLYAGKLDDRPRELPGDLGKDRQLRSSFGSIYKFSPTGSLARGNLYPTEPEGPARVYDVPYGSISSVFARASFFGVDGWGRIYYPSSLLSRVSVIDNEGNEILRCGTYGNRDSAGGLDGDLVPTEGVPMAYPNAVDVTDDYIYVGDIVNCRLLRLARTFAASERVEVK